MWKTFAHMTLYKMPRMVSQVFYPVVTISICGIYGEQTRVLLYLLKTKLLMRAYLYKY